LPDKFFARDARLVCELLNGKSHDFAIFSRFLEKDEQIQRVDVPVSTGKKGRPARMYEKLGEYRSA
jgi:hypothetical protein